MAGILSGLLKMTGMGRSDAPFSEETLVCPTCGDEYRSGFQRCAVCDRQLVAMTSRAGGPASASTKDPSRRLEISKDDRLLTIRQGTLVEIKRLRRLLAQAGIAALPVGEGSVRGGCCPSASFMLQIRADDHDAAQAVLADDYRRLTDLENLDAIAETRVVVDDDGREGQRCAGCGGVLTAEQTECPDCGLSYAPR